MIQTSNHRDPNEMFVGLGKMGRQNQTSSDEAACRMKRSEDFNELQDMASPLISDFGCQGFNNRRLSGVKANVNVRFRAEAKIDEVPIWDHPSGKKEAGVRLSERLGAHITIALH